MGDFGKGLNHEAMCVSALRLDKFLHTMYVTNEAHVPDEKFHVIRKHRYVFREIIKGIVVKCSERVLQRTLRFLP